MVVKDRFASPAQNQVFTGSVTAKDGAAIGYRRFGQGPGLIVLHGSMESSQSHLQLAEALADVYTVFLIDRRGRGLSGPYSKEYSIQKDVEDVEAILNQTGARCLFGVSSGAIISLQAALSLPAIQKIAIYEPPLSLTRAAAESILVRYDREMAQGRLAAALVTGMKGAQMGPPIFNAMPRWLLELLTTLGMNQEDKRARAGDVTMRMLAPTLHYDFSLVLEMSERLEKFAGLKKDVLLLGGNQSPAYLRTALDQLEKMLPQARRVEFPGLGHGGSGNTDRGGHPEVVAEELRRFFE